MVDFRFKNLAGERRGRKREGGGEGGGGAAQEAERL